MNTKSLPISSVLIASFVLIGLLCINGSSSSSQSISLNSLVPMELVGEDETGDGGSLDIVSAYMGDTDQFLLFIVEYAGPSEYFLWSNVTLRNEAGQLFLILAFWSQDSNNVLVTHATSLEEDNWNTGEEDLLVFYENRILNNYTEIQFYVDWEVFGGPQEMDVVFWTDRPISGAFDRLPNEGYITYVGVNGTDTEMYIGAEVDQTTSAILSFSSSELSSNDISSDLQTVTEEVGVSGNDTVTEEGLGFDLPVSRAFIIPFLGLIIYRKKKGK